jgi:dipeptidyl-peptidase-4
MQSQTPSCPRGRYWLTAALVVLVSGAAAAQQRTLTIGDIYDPSTRENFSGSVPANISWIDGTHYALPRNAAGGVAWVSVDAAAGTERPLYDPAKMEAALAKLPGVAANDARRLARSRSLIFNGKHSAALLTMDSDLYLYSFESDEAVRLTSTEGAEELPSFSPDDRLVAFIRHNDLYVVDIASQGESRLTTDGAAKILNGSLDWVYEEEIYGRGSRRAYWWSPDSSRVAFLRIDDTPVPAYVTVDDIAYEQTVEHWDWPKAGDPNPTVTLGVVRAAGGSIEWVNTDNYPAPDRLIVGVGWTPDSQEVVYEVQNRIQSWLDLDTMDVSAGTTSTVLRETSKAFIDPGEYQPPTWLKDGSFLWLSDTSGWKHLYHYSAAGALIKQVTSGKWELRTLHGIDPATGWIYFSGTERSPIGGDVYRVKLDGSGFERLSKTAGTHTAHFGPTFTYYIDSWSDVTTPTQMRLHKSNGNEVRVVDENKVAALAQYKLVKPEFLQVTTRDGFVMEAMMIKPPDFDPSRRYPVYQFTYAGPHHPQVRNAWPGSEGMYHQLLAQKGIIVWVCDNRTASGKGAESTWQIYRNAGELELRDIEDGLTWLSRQPYVDGSRVGIHGWSYGGYMTSYALTHSTRFVMGIAGGTVSDWRNYDTVYTERYMGLPEDNPEGYRKSSPRWAARDLHGALFLIHGAVDDNVHVSNTMQFAYELQKAEKPFQMMLYPKARHGVTDPAQVMHLRTAMLAFVLEHLKPDQTPVPPTTASGHP